MQTQMKKILKQKANQGITLIALVVTIVVLLILAGVTINTLTSPSGIITSAEKAKERQEVENLKDMLSIKALSWTTGKKLNEQLDIEDYFKSLVTENIIADRTDVSATPDENGVYLITTNEGYVFGAVLDDNDNIIITYEGLAGKLPPKLIVKSKTTNSVTVEVIRVEKVNSYKYFYKTLSGNYDTGVTKSSNTYTYTNLTQNTVYMVKAELTANGIDYVLETTVEVGELVKPKVELKNKTWTNGKATAVITVEAGTSQLQWQKGGITEGNWTTVSAGTTEFTVTGISHNETIYVRSYDGTQGGVEYATVNIKDGDKPTVTVTKGSSTTNSITVNVTATDAETGMPASSTYSYYIKKHSDSSYPATATHTGTESSYTFSGLSQTTAYDIKVTTSDIAGNEGTGTLLNTTTGTIGGATDGLKSGNIIASNASWSNGTASITLSTTTGLTIEWQIGNITEGKWTTGTSVTGLSHGSVVYARLTDGVNVGDYGSINIQDGTAPTVTVTKGSVNTSSITVSVTSSDGQSGMPASPSYSYYIKKQTDASYPTTASYTGTNASYTFTGLTQTTAYDVKVTTKDKVNNTGTGTLLNTTTGTVGGATAGLKTGNIIASSASWSNGTASITLSTTTGLTIEWQIGNITEGRWTKGTSVTGLKNGNVVYARLTDGNNVGDSASVNIADGLVPQNATISLSSTSVTAGTGINATVTHKDNESGIVIGNCKWVYNTTASAIGINVASYTGGTFSSNPQTISLNTSTPGTYYLHVLSTDVAGNKKETISSAVTVKAPLTTDGSYVASKGVNSPKLGTGMTPVRWNGSSWVEAKTNDEWYNYTSGSKQWANAQTSDGSMWVWIPRYAYQIASNWHTNTAGTVNIKFLQNTGNTASDGTTSWTNSSGQGNWNVHPAFSYGSQAAGIWVAKFEASQSNATSSSAGSSNVIKIQPGVQSWRSITINDIYSKSLSYNSTLNSHQMKNSEWGAVAYLAQSVYGKNSEVWINPNQNYITGQAGTSESASGTTSTNAYNTTNGMQASTTGNIYGIYDMSGGAWEYTAAYVNNGHANLNSYGASLVGGNAKTKDVYTSATSSGANTQSADYETAKGKYGDAVYETSSSYSNSNGSWYGDYAGFPCGQWPFVYRGGGYSGGSVAGLFCFDYEAGGASSACGFRPVLVVL